MSKTATKKSDARQRIVETAERLFYAEGVRTVGIDRIIAESEVAKMTLYNHFPSKDDLILAVMQYREEKFDDLRSDTNSTGPSERSRFRTTGPSSPAVRGATAAYICLT